MKRIYFFFIALIFLLYVFCFYGPLSHVVYYHEQHQLFLFSKHYFNQVISQDGVLAYLTAFVVQFFYYPLLGACILSTLLTATYVIGLYTIRKFFKVWDLLHLSLIPSLLLLNYSSTVEHSLQPIILVFLLYLLIGVGAFIWSKYGKPTELSYKYRWKNRTSLFSLITFIAILGLESYYFVSHYNRAERIILRTEQFVKQKKWRKVLDYCTFLKTGKVNKVLFNFRNLALANVGQLPYRFLEYPNTYGIRALYFPWEGNLRDAEYGHYPYEITGHLNEAIRWASEALVINGAVAPHLLNLARYNLALNKPKVAQRYINILKQSLFYHTIASKLEQGMEAPIHNALQTPKVNPMRFANIIDLGPEMAYICENDTLNKKAFDYMMVDLLLTNRVEHFVRCLFKMKEYGYKTLPPLYEEALLVYKITFPNAVLPFEWDVSDATYRRFQRFYQLVQEDDRSALNAEFKTTYWYYLTFLSPYGNKIITNWSL